MLSASSLTEAPHGVSQNFAVAVDDHNMKITHVLRAEEHLANTLRQVRCGLACQHMFACILPYEQTLRALLAFKHLSHSLGIA